MCIRKIHVTVFLYLVLSAGCASTYAPIDWLPETEEVPQHTFGGWITITTFPDTINNEERWLQYGGEFISTDEINIYMLYDTVYIINKQDIFKATLELDEKNSTEYSLWTFGGCLATISNGLYLIITAPIWLFGGIPVTVGESSRDIYETENPDESYWISIKKFARFPQGLPGNIDIKNLKPKTDLLN